MGTIIISLVAGMSSNIRDGEKPAGGIPFMIGVGVVFFGVIFDVLGPLALFLIMLPLANGLIDWLSLGVSRILGEALRVKRSVPNIAIFTLVDLIGAIFFLAAISFILGFFAEVGLELATKGLETKINVGVQQYMRSLVEGTWVNIIWLALMVWSTLLPTALHLTILVYALFTLTPLHRPNSWLVLFLASEEKPSRRTCGRAARIYANEWLAATAIGVAVLTVTVTVLAGLIHAPEGVLLKLAFAGSDTAASLFR